MAKIVQESVVVTFSKISKNVEESSEILSDDIMSSMEQIIQELVQPGVIVEIERVTL